MNVENKMENRVYDNNIAINHNVVSNEHNSFSTPSVTSSIRGDVSSCAADDIFVISKSASLSRRCLCTSCVGSDISSISRNGQSNNVSDINDVDPNDDNYSNIHEMVSTTAINTASPIERSISCDSVVTTSNGSEFTNIGVTKLTSPQPVAQPHKPSSRKYSRCCLGAVVVAVVVVFLLLVSFGSTVLVTKFTSSAQTGNQLVTTDPPTAFTTAKPKEKIRCYVCSSHGGHCPANGALNLKYSDEPCTQPCFTEVNGNDNYFVYRGCVSGQSERYVSASTDMSKCHQIQRWPGSNFSTVCFCHGNLCNIHNMISLGGRD